MTLWLDAQLSPKLAAWLRTQFAVEATALRDFGLRDSTDIDLFFAAREANAVIITKDRDVIITKDRDFVELRRRFGSPPQLILLTCGNTSNKVLKEILQSNFSRALAMLNRGESFVEIRG